MDGDGPRAKGSYFPPSHKKTALLNLWVHDDRFSKEDVVLSHQSVPGVKEGDLLEVYHPTQDPSSSPKKVIVQVQKGSLDKELLSKQPQLQISIAQPIATQFELQTRRDVVAKRIDEQAVTADFIELVFRDQYVGRSEMWRLKLSLNGTPVYEGKKVSSLGVRAQVKEIYVNGTRSSCGFVTHKTRTIFRSETAKCFIFIQMSRDMWEFDEDGDMFAEKCVHGFLPDLFSRWKTSGSNHVVSIILFSRIFYEKEKEEATNMFVQDAEEGKKDKDGNDIGISVDAFGRYYRDFYRVVVDWETRANWASVLIPIKKEFVKFQKDVLERRDTSGSTILSGTNSYSSEGNVLEAINLALNPFDKHYIDRDLIRTGLSVVVVTPGVGAFEVDRKLCRLTSQRLIDNGIGLDLVCLSKPPLYTTPLFQFMTNNVDGHFQSAQPELSSSAAGRFDKPSSSYDYKTTPEFWDPLYFDSNSTGSQRLYYWIPHWVNCSFWTRDDGVQSKGFSPRCKMPELQMAGSFEVMYSGLIVPTLLDNASISQDSTGDGINLPTGGAGLYDYDAYDDTVFSSRLASSRLMSRDESGTGIGETNTRLGVSPDSGATLGRMDINKVASVSPDFSYNTMHSIGQFVRSGDTRKKTDLDHLLKGGFGELGDEVASEDRAAFLKIKALVEQSKDTSLKSIKSNMSLVSMFSKFTVDSYQGTETMVSAKPRSGFPPRNPDASPMMEEAPDYAYTSMSPIKIRSHAREIDSHYSRGSYSTSYKAPTGSPSDLSRYIQKPSPGRLANQMSRQTIRQTFVNPCNPSKNVIKLSSHVRRWQHVYPRLAQARLSSTMDWKSLCVPACLPLTTDFFPTEDDLRNYYQEYTYTVNPADDSVYQDDSDNERRKVEALLTELISQRLAQGFQLITDVVDGKQKGGVDGVDLSDEKNKVISISSPYYLNLGDHVHRLFYDASGKNIEVKRYVRRINYETSSISYACAIWPKHIDFYHPKTFTFDYQTLANYNWNYLDNLISGYQDDMTDALRFWRARYLLIPMEAPPLTTSGIFGSLNLNNEVLDDEEARLAGFLKFLDLFEKARYVNPKEKLKISQNKKELQQGRAVNIIMTTFNATTHVKNELLKTEASQKRDASTPSTVAPAAAEKLTKTSPLESIAKSMQSPSGVSLKDRRWHFKLYERVFIGSECVDWLVREFSDIDTRDEAVEFGNKLLSTGFFEHVNSKHMFLDGHYFYRLKKESVILESKDRAMSLSWFRTRSETTSSNELFGASNESGASAPILQKANSPVVLSKMLVVEMDPQHVSARKEIAILHYDTTHNAKNCFHFQIHWLMCTARLIENMLQTWSRMAEKCGLKLVESPVTQANPLSDDNPFESVIPIHFAIPPHSIRTINEEFPADKIPDEWFERELLKKFNFVLDVEADYIFQGYPVAFSYTRTPVKHTQFVHRSGVCIVQILPQGKGLIWTKNRLHMTSINPTFLGRALNPAVNVDAIREELTAFCHDRVKLETFWSHLAHSLSSVSTLNELPEEVSSNVMDSATLPVV